MKLVTTSRKPAPELRTLGKDLAFALGGENIPPPWEGRGLMKYYPGEIPFWSSHAGGGEKP